MIPDEVIEQVRDAADLVDIIGEAVTLKRTGTDYRGPCPFHGGTHRNFAVIPKKGMYYCYVCHVSGDVFSYLMKRFGMDYPTAVREVARRAGIVIPESQTRAGPDPREPLFGALAVAQEWLAARLREAPDAREARSYLESRDIPMTVAAEHGLGFAPKDRSFLDAMRQLGVSEAVLIEAGLLVRREDGTIAPRFRGRLLFPIRDLRGRVVAFGGRILGRGEPKYLNSPESPVFHKGGSLYNLFAAKNAIRREEAAVVVEGYFDVLRLVLAGLEHVVAPLGTALTGDQAALLKRYAPSVILLYDSDAPGLRAAFRAGDECLRHGLRVKVATLPPGDDPDTLARRGGAAAVEAVLRDAADVFERKIQLLEQKGWFNGVERRREALDRLLPTVRATSDEIARDLYLGRLVERTGVSRTVLERELTQAPARSAPVMAPPQSAPRSRPPLAPVPRPERGRPGAKIERQLLQVLLADPSWLARARSEVAPSLFEVPALREVYEALLAEPNASAPGDAAGRLSPRALEAWQQLAEVGAGHASAGLNLDEEYAGAVDRLRERALARQIALIPDVDERRRQFDRLSPWARQWYSWQREAGRADSIRSHSRSRQTDPRSQG